MSHHSSELGVAGIEEIAENIHVLHARPSENEVVNWAKENSQCVADMVKKFGVLLIRGLPVVGSKKLEKILSTLFNSGLLEYTYRSTPRTKMRGKVYTSTEYASDLDIVLHNENSYSNTWPMNIAFYCVKPAMEGGETPIADSRKIYSELPKAIVNEFENRKLKYVRNYGNIDLPWAEVFQTHDRRVVESFCIKNRICFEWEDANKLRTWQTNNATYLHPASGEKVWFNQAHLFHVSSLDCDVRKSLLQAMAIEDLPRNVYFGDGSVIDDELIDEIRNTYSRHSFLFKWLEGDLLILDNMMYAHGRRPFSGARSVLVGMLNSVNMEDFL